MRLTTKGRFAVTAMLDVALHSGEHPVSLSAVAERQSISLSYLEQLFGKLRRSGLVDSVRGPGGGYVLARDATDISVAHIVQAVDETLDARQCEGKRDCSNGQECMTHALWHGLNATIFDYLDSVTLNDLIASHRARKTAPKITQPAQLLQARAV